MSRRPIIRQTAWVSIIPQLIVFAVLIALFYLTTNDLRLSVLLCCITYLILSRGSKGIVLRHHRKGMLCVRSNDYATAAAHFENSFDLLRKYPAFDKFRYILLLDSSYIPYTEMALINLAYCSIKLEQIDKAKQYYHKALELFPDSEIAKEALSSIENIESSDK